MAMCKLTSFLQAVTVSASIQTLVIISVDRIPSTMVKRVHQAGRPPDVRKTYTGRDDTSVQDPG
ncbi:neuropeptide Y receptor-like [Tropilaelaps mercedesae]|uniref:Neuropeptide Y receptor-like n=1 Tax=Tropilaelaps mercedesae TaxID=418985 RepID=A0A1V9XSK4_9ACAR|nr:neuropeptide Y receptor-like [Tropilaelaps mercedesae]